jgi:hypothetical protein
MFNNNNNNNNNIPLCIRLSEDGEKLPKHRGQYSIKNSLNAQDG